jgi:predicted small lipoprotein YifL
VSRTKKRLEVDFMKKVFLVLPAALAVISLAACGPGTSKKSPEKLPQTEQKQKNKSNTEQSSKKPTQRRQTQKKQIPKKQEPNKNNEKRGESNSKKSNE